MQGAPRDRQPRRLRSARCRREASTVNGVLRVGHDERDRERLAHAVERTPHGDGVAGQRVELRRSAGVSFTGPGCDATGPQTGACVSAGIQRGAEPAAVARRRRIALRSRVKASTSSASFGPTGLHASGSLRVRRPRESDDHRRPVVRELAPGRDRPRRPGRPAPGAGGRLPLHRPGQRAPRPVERIVAPRRPRQDRRRGVDQGRRAAPASAVATSPTPTIRLDNLGMSADGDINVPSPVPGGVALSIHLDGRVDFATADEAARVLADRLAGGPVVERRSGAAGPRPRARSH